MDAAEFIFMTQLYKFGEGKQCVREAVVNNGL